MEKRHRNEPTTSTEPTRRQLLMALTGSLLALLGLGTTTAPSPARRRNRKSARLAPLPR